MFSMKVPRKSLLNLVSLFRESPKHVALVSLFFLVLFFCTSPMSSALFYPFHVINLNFLRSGGFVLRVFILSREYSTDPDRCGH